MLICLVKKVSFHYYLILIEVKLHVILVGTPNKKDNTEAILENTNILKEMNNNLLQLKEIEEKKYNLLKTTMEQTQDYRSVKLQMYQ